MKTAIYTRKSTLKVGQKETIENQIKICKRKAKELGLVIVDVKTDSATGTDDNSRPEVKELIKDAINGNYQCVIMKGISRLYRKTSKGLELIERLDQSGIRVVTVEEHFDSFAPENRTGTGKLDLSRLTMYLMFAEMESKKLADRVKYTQIEKAYAGEWNQPSSVPYGYEYVPETKKLQIKDSQADIIRLIFKLYIEGMGMKSIAHYLNGNNQDKIQYPSPKSKRWNEYTIGFILKNEVYIGSVVYNKRSKKERPYKNPEAIGKTTEDIYIGNDFNDKDKWITVKNAHDPIIGEDTFSKAQEIMGVKAARKGIRNNVSLFAGVAKCGKCGHGMTFKRGKKNSDGKVVTRNNYYCMNYIRYGSQYCDSHHVRAEDLEETIFNKLDELRNNKEQFDQIFNDSIKHIDDGSVSDDKEMKRIEKEIEQVAKKMDKLLEKNMEGKINDNQFELFNKRYSDDLDRLTSRLEEIKLKSQNNIDKELLLKSFRNRLDEIADYRNKSLEEKRYTILKLIDFIIIEDGIIKHLQFNFSY
ncbi:recombinase family protein [Paenibacillus naphthalenovorans]|uniref:Resolvase n=1 Tax=Paenibacillus naphthalenovorans TaxID=162209 RepID=A0A0U2M3R8_9BACL|nr:recombinase family protein [Paenibacillus naphthalenovorans]ALS22080.1 resolvase [Paenibacillus naphthalenovorans]